MNTPHLTIEEIDKVIEAHEPNEAIKAELGGIVLAPIIGPAAVGKSTLIDFISDNFQGFDRSAGLTTRQRRPNERADQYTFLPHTDETIEELLDRSRSGDLVQIARHPITNHMYGSEISSYNSPYTLIDLLAGSVKAMKELPFGAVKEISLVSMPEVWDVRFSPRIKNDPNDAMKRVVEGIESIEWSLDQGPTMNWVNNPDDQLHDTAIETVGIITGEYGANPKNRNVGEKLLRHLRVLETSGI